MLDFSLNTDACTGCGECVKECLCDVIAMGDDFPHLLEGGEERCIGCQHCLAVCKPGALSIFGKDPADSRPLKGNLPEPAQMETLIMGRRSTRRYKKEGVDPALIRHLLEVASHAPTAVNQRRTQLTVVDTPEAMDKLRDRAMASALKMLRENSFPKGLERLAGYFQKCESGEDAIFRNATHLLVASAPADSLSPMADCHIVMSYFELLANSHGLGTVWNGIARIMLDQVAPELRDLLGIPKDHVLACAMAFGKPAVQFYRTVQRPGGTIHRAEI